MNLCYLSRERIMFHCKNEDTNTEFGNLLVVIMQNWGGGGAEIRIIWDYLGICDS